MSIKFIKFQLAFTVCLLCLNILLFDFTDLDVDFQNLFYNSKTHLWLIDLNDPIKDFIFYSGLKHFLTGIPFVIGIVYFFNKRKTWFKNHKKELLAFTLSISLIPLTVATIKHVTNMPCPKNITVYGGRSEHYGLLEFHKRTSKRYLCYPAGHASAGFGFFALLVFFKKRKSRALALVFAMSLGWTMGMYKLAAGDHFLSHNISTMLVAWILFLIISYIVFHKLEFKDASDEQPSDATQVSP